MWNTCPIFYLSPFFVSAILLYSPGTTLLLLKLEICRVLLGAGAAVAARDHSNRCPLHYAGNYLDVTQLLLDFGADPEAQV